MAVDPLVSKLIKIAADLLNSVPAGEDFLSTTTPRYVQRKVIKAFDDLHNGNCERAIALKGIADELRARGSSAQETPAECSCNLANETGASRHAPYCALNREVNQ